MSAILPLFIFSSTLVLTLISLAADDGPINSSLTSDRISMIIPNLTTIRINSTPTGAEVWLDGQYSGQLTPGKFVFKKAENHSFDLRLYGYDWQAIDLNTSNSVDVDVNLSAGLDLTRGPTGPVIDVYIDSHPPGAEVWKDNKNTGKTTPFYEPSGVFEAHDYDLRLKGYKNYKVLVITDQDINYKVSLGDPID